jgi:hypothetical protein
MPKLACESFATVEELLADQLCACDLDEDDETEIQEAIDAASDILYVLSGGKVTGKCTKTKRPLRRGGCAPNGYDAWYDLYGVDTIPLPYDLLWVEEVVIDGVVLDPSEYGLIDNRLLYRKVGWWPSSNNLRLDDTEVGTWSITYTFGGQVGWIEKGAALEIACQLIEDDRNGRGYLRNITSANVQGASVSIEAAASSMASRGLPRTERYLGAFISHGGLPVGVWAPELENGWTLAEVEGPSGS